MPSEITVTKVAPPDPAMPRWARWSGAYVAAAAPVDGESLAHTGTFWIPLAALPLAGGALYGASRLGDAGQWAAGHLEAHRFPRWARRPLERLRNADTSTLVRLGVTVVGGLGVLALDGAASGIWASPAMGAWVVWGTATTAIVHRATGRRRTPRIDVPQLDAIAAEWAQYVGCQDGAMPGSVLTHVIRVPAEKGGGWEGIAVGRRGKAARVEHQDLASGLDVPEAALAVERLDARRLKVRFMERDPLQHAPDFGSVMAPMDDDGRIRVGTHRDGTPAMLRLQVPRKSALHLFLIGATGSGKGGLLDVILAQLRKSGAALWYLDGKGGQSAPHWSGQIDRYTATDDQHAAAFTALRSLIATRKAASTALRWTDAKGREHVGRKTFVHGDPWPLVYVVVDEANVLLQDPEAAEVVRVIATQGRSLGLGLIIAGQSPNLEDLGGGAIVRDSLKAGGSLVLLRTADPNMARTAIGSLADGAEIAPVPAEFADGTPAFGMGYIVGRGGLQTFRTLYLPDDPEDAKAAGVMDIFDVIEHLQQNHPLVSVSEELPAPEAAPVPGARPAEVLAMAASVAPVEQAAGTQDRIRKHLAGLVAKGHRRVLTAQLRRDLDLTPSQARNAISRLKAHGLLADAGKGAWTITDQLAAAA